MPPLCYFVRHGQTGWNAEFRLQGQADTDMTELGRRQAIRNGKRLAALIPNPEDFDFVASPLTRTRETMELVRAEIGLPAKGYRVDARLMEVHFGGWQGFTYAELEGRALPTNGGSSPLALAVRATGCCWIAFAPGLRGWSGRRSA
jgi:probable phosphoglycerate mutase